MAQSPNVQWLKEQNYFAGEAYSIAEDSDGNIFVAGTFSDEFDIDPSEDELILNPVGQGSSYIAKFDSSGNFLTAITLFANASTGTSAPNALVDARNLKVISDGSVIIGGLFRGSLSIAGDDDLIESNPNYDGFIAKLDSDLNYQWNKRIRSIGSGVDAVVDFEIAGNDDIYVLAQVQTGSTNGGLEINSTVYFDSSLMTHAVIRFDAGGGFLNACHFFSGTMSKIALDENSNVYISFISGAMNTAFNNQDFLGEAPSTVSALSLEPDLSAIRWSERPGGNSFTSVTGLIHKHAALYVYGRSAGTIDTEVFSDRQIFLSKIDDENGDFIWTKQLGMLGSESEVSVSLAEYDDLLIACGTYSDILNLESTNLISNGGADNFLIAYNSEGQVSFIHSLGSTSSDNRMILST